MAKAGKPVAKLAPLTHPSKPRVPGRGRGTFTMSDADEGMRRALGLEVAQDLVGDAGAQHAAVGFDRPGAPGRPAHDAGS